MFSTTTIASSTTKPVEMVSAINDRLAMLKPHRYITPKVPISEIGTARPGIMVARKLRRNRKTTLTTRQNQINSVPSTSLTDALMLVVRSSTTLRSIDAGIDACRAGG